VDRIEDESLWLRSPEFADVVVKREAAQHLQAMREIICIQEVGEVAAKLIVAVIVIPLDRCVCDRVVHSFNLTFGPRMVRLCQPVFDPMSCASHIEAHGPRIGSVSVAGLVCKLDDVVRENGVDLLRNGFEQVLKQLQRRLAVCFVDQLRNGELAGAIDGHEEM